MTERMTTMKRWITAAAVSLAALLALTACGGPVARDTAAAVIQRFIIVILSVIKSG